MKNEQVIERRARITDRPRKRIGGLHRKARPEQSGIKRRVAGGQRARGGVPDDLPDAEILKKIAGTVLGHGFSLIWLSHGFGFNKGWRQPGFRLPLSYRTCLNRPSGPRKASHFD